MIFWTRARIGLTAAATFGALLMLYEGLFEIQKIDWLLCPVFKGGCESVSSAAMSYPLGFAHGLLAAALMGLIVAAAQGRERGPALLLVVLSGLAALAGVVRAVQMFLLGAHCTWCWLWILSSLACAALSLRCLREQAASAPAGRSPPTGEPAPKP